MKVEKKSLRKVLVYSSIMLVIAIALIFSALVSISNEKEKEIKKLKENISDMNICLDSIEKMETSFQRFINIGNVKYADEAIGYASTIIALISEKPEIFMSTDDVLLYSHSVEQISEAIEYLIKEKIYQKLDNENAFQSIKTVETAFDFLSKSTLSMTRNYTFHTSIEITRINEKYDRANIMFILFFILIVPLLLLYFLSVIKTASRAFATLEKASESLTNGKWDYEDLPPSGYKEIDLASQSFNIMKSKIKENFDNINEKMKLNKLLSEKTIESEKQKRHIQEAQFKLLQAQINPHFLFNTLNMITNNVREGKRNLEMADILVATSRLLRYSIEIKESAIPLRRELELLDDYITIQKARNKGRIKFFFNIEEELPPLLIPPFSLQPLIENSIVHGLKDILEGGEISVYIFRDEDEGVLISISDNGSGMSEEAKKKALRGEGNGLGNTIKRLRYLYKTEDTLVFASPKIGTTINIHLVPLKG